jgi:hypothetical protein
MKPRPEIALRTVCVFCGEAHDCVSNVELCERGPESGDATICIECGEWLVFDDHLALRRPTDDEYLEIGLDENMRRVRTAWVAVTASLEKKKARRK